MSAQHSCSLSAQRLFSALVSLISRCVRLRLVCLPAVAVLLGSLVPAPRAATDTVTTLSGSVSTSGSLPYEIAHAATGDTIVSRPG
jgi:hypothetical protein